MDATAWTIILSAAGAVGTFSLGLFADSWRARLNTAAASAERAALRAAARQDRREDFELATLLELQDVLQAMARQVGRAHYADEAHFRTTGRWLTGAPPLPDDVGGESSLPVRWAFLRLKGRVPSEELRAILTSFQSSSNAAITTTPGNGTDDRTRYEDARRLMAQMTDDLEAAQDALGARIRQLHAPGT